MGDTDVLEERREQIRSLLTDAITVLCKNTMAYSSELHVEGLLGITTDKKDIFLVNIKELITNSKVSSSDSTTTGRAAGGKRADDSRDEDDAEGSRYSSSERSPSPVRTDNLYNSSAFPLGATAFPDVITIKDEPCEVVVSDDSRLMSPHQLPHGQFLNKDIVPKEYLVRPVIPTLSPPFRPPISWPGLYTAGPPISQPALAIPSISGLSASASSVTSSEEKPHIHHHPPFTAINSTDNQHTVTSPPVSAAGHPPVPIRTRVHKGSDSHVSLGKNLVTDRYYCSCGQQFRHSSSLTRHLRMNEQAKRGGVVFKCHLCGSKMNRRDNLRSHLIKNHGVKFGASLESTIAQNSMIMVSEQHRDAEPDQDVSMSLQPPRLSESELEDGAAENLDYEGEGMLFNSRREGDDFGSNLGRIELDSGDSVRLEEKDDPMTSGVVDLSSEVARLIESEEK